MHNKITQKNSLTTSFSTLVLFCVLTISSSNSHTAAPNQSKTFTCIADGTNRCGCLRQNDGSGLIWYQTGLNNNARGYFFHDAENALQEFNAENHCGYNDWRIPKFAAKDDEELKAYGVHLYHSDDAYVYEKTDLARLSNYAIRNGYKVKNNFVDWLNGNGFNLANGGYWAANYFTPGLDNAWVINRHNNGVIEVMYAKNNNFIIPVRGGV